MALTLASCNLNGVTSGDVMGSISSAPTGQGTIRMAVLGISLGGVSNAYTEQLTVVPNNKGVFAVNLPASPAVGGYEVIAYADKNENKKYDIGEPRTKSNGKTLVYSDGGVLGTLLGLSKGWNQVENLKVTDTTIPFSGYDLSF